MLNQKGGTTMKRIAVLIAAALMALTISLPAAAEPDDNDTDTTSSVGETVDESQTVEPDDNTEDDTDDTENSDTDDTDNTDDTENSTEEDTQSDGAESSTADNTADNTKNNSRDGAETSETSEASKTAAAVKYTEYSIDEAHLTLSFPSDMYVITRATDKDDPVLALNRTTKDEVMKNFQENDIYFRAVPKDFSCVVNITISETEDTRMIGQLAALSEDNLQNIIDKLLSSEIYTGCTKSIYNGVPFLTFTIGYQNDDANIHGVQQYTIINGQNVRLTYQTAAETDKDPNQAMFDKVMNSVQFERVAQTVDTESSLEAVFDLNEVDVRYIYIGIASFVALLSLMIIVVAARKYKNSRLIAELFPEDSAPSESSEPSKPEEKDIFSDTAKKNLSNGETAPKSPEIKPMTYEDVVTGQPQAVSPAEPFHFPPPPQGRQNRKNRKAHRSAVEEVVFAGNSEKRYTEIEQVSAADETTAAVASKPSPSVSGSTENSQSVPDKTAAVSLEKPLHDAAAAAAVSAVSSDSDKKARSIELEISQSDDGSLLIGATKEDDGKPVNIEIRDETRLAEKEDKKLEAMGFETARHNEIYNAVLAEKDEKPFVVKAKTVAAPEQPSVPSSKDKTPAAGTTGKKKSDKQSAPKKGKTAKENKTSQTSEVKDMFDPFNSSETRDSRQNEPEEQPLSEFERNSGITVERAPVPTRPVVPMKSAFTEIPRLESVNAAEYNRQYEEMKSNMPKNHAYAQRFRTGETKRSAKSAPAVSEPPVVSESPVVPETPAAAEPPAAKAVESSPWEDAFVQPAESAKNVNDAAAQEDAGALFDFYTGYEPSAQEAEPVQPPVEEANLPKKKGGMGSRFRKTLGKFFAPEPPYDEE